MHELSSCSVSYSRAINKLSRPPVSFVWLALCIGRSEHSCLHCLQLTIALCEVVIPFSFDPFFFFSAAKGILSFNYGWASSNVKRLQELGVRVLHEIDATKMSGPDCCLSTMKFDRIVFNFPHAGFFYRETSAFQIE